MKKIILFVLTTTMCFTTACNGAQATDTYSEVSCSGSETTVESGTLEEMSESTDAEQVDLVADWEYVEWAPGRELKEGDSVQLGCRQFYQGKAYLLEYDVHTPSCRWFIGENSLSASLKDADGSETDLVIYTFCLTDEYMVFSSRLEGDPIYYGHGDGLRIFVKEQDGNVRQIAESIQDAYVDGGKLVALNMENQVQIYDLASGNMEKQVQPEGMQNMYYMCREYLIYSNAEREVVHYYLDSESTKTVGFSGIDGKIYSYFVASGNLLGYNNQDRKAILLYEQGEKTSGVLNLPELTECIYGNWAFCEEGLEVKAYNIATEEYRIIYTIPVENEEKGIETYIHHYSRDTMLVTEYHSDSHKKYYYEVDLEGNSKFLGEQQMDSDI